MTADNSGGGGGGDGDGSSIPPRPRDYVVANGLRYVTPYLHEFVIKVSEKHVGATVWEALMAHVKYQGQVDGSRSFWEGEIAAGRVAVVCDVLRRLPTGGAIPPDWWARPVGPAILFLLPSIEPQGASHGEH